MVGELSVTVHKLEGDVTGDCVVNLQDAIAGLKICIGEPVFGNINGDVNGDNQLGIEEVIYVLDQAAK